MTTTQSFENLDFSFLIEPDRNTAYLQEWEDGAWSEAEVFAIPVPLDQLPKKSRLARALQSFRKNDQFDALRSAVGGEFIRATAPSRNLWDLLQSSSRGLAARIVEFIYA